MSVRTSMSTPVSTDINASIITEVIGDSVYAYITFDPLQQNVVGTQFQLNYDNLLLKFNNVTFKTKGSPMNFANDKGSYINLGSLVSDGTTSLDKTGWANNPSILAIFISILVLIIFYIGILYYRN